MCTNSVDRGSMFTNSVDRGSMFTNSVDRGSMFTNSVDRGSMFTNSVDRGSMFTNSVDRGSMLHCYTGTCVVLRTSQLLVYISIQTLTHLIQTWLICTSLNRFGYDCSCQPSTTVSGVFTFCCKVQTESIQCLKVQNKHFYVSDCRSYNYILTIYCGLPIFHYSYH